MAPNLRAGTFKIVSLLEGNPPAGVSYARPASQGVHLNGPVMTWRIKEDGHKTYRLGLGGYPFTGEIDDKVTVTVHRAHNLEWHATYRAFHDAYTIEPSNGRGKGWTVPFGADTKSYAMIELEHLIVHPSEPPRFASAQLFRFVPVQVED